MTHFSDKKTETLVTYGNLKSCNIFLEKLNCAGSLKLANSNFTFRFQATDCFSWYFSVYNERYCFPCYTFTLNTLYNTLEW